MVSGIGIKISNLLFLDISRVGGFMMSTDGGEPPAKVASVILGGFRWGLSKSRRILMFSSSMRFFGAYLVKKSTYISISAFMRFFQHSPIYKVDLFIEMCKIGRHPSPIRVQMPSCIQNISRVGGFMTATSYTLSKFLGVNVKRTL